MRPGRVCRSSPEETAQRAKQLFALLTKMTNSYNSSSAISFSLEPLPIVEEEGAQLCRVKMVLTLNKNIFAVVPKSIAQRKRHYYYSSDGVMAKETVLKFLGCLFPEWHRKEDKSDRRSQKNNFTESPGAVLVCAGKCPDVVLAKQHRESIQGIYLPTGVSSTNKACNFSTTAVLAPIAQCFRQCD